MTTELERLKQMMTLLGVEPKKSLGQNFLIADHVIEKIVGAASVLISEFKINRVLEIGPGLGALTVRLTKLPKYNSTDCVDYTALELDQKFSSYWREQGLNLVEVDALRADWVSLTGDDEGAAPILVSNLPYQISSSLVIDRSLDRVSLAGMVLMFQKEVAQRIRAQDGEHYGMLSVVAQTFWQIEMLLEAGARDFLPPPKVASRVLVFRRKNSPVKNKKAFLSFVKSAFHQRRKLLTSNLKSLNTDVSVVQRWLEENKYSLTARAEEISVRDYVRMFQELGLDR